MQLTSRRKPLALISLLSGLAILFTARQAAAFSYASMSCSPGQLSANSTDTHGLTAICGGRFNLCGYVDDGGKTVIPQHFEVALPFSDGLAGVRIDGKYAFIDPAGKLVTSAKFDFVGNFENGLAEVILDGRAGAIDRWGNSVVEPKYARAMPFGARTVLVTEGVWKPSFSRDCESVRDAQGTLLLELKSPSYRLFDVQTGLLSADAYSLKYFDTPARGLLWASPTKTKGPNAFGLLNTDGHWQTEPQFEKVNWFHNGSATVCVNAAESDSAKRETCGAVDANGRLVIPLKFDGPSYWQNGLSLVREANETGIMDLSGRLLGNRYFDEVKLAERGDISLVRIDDEWVGLDRQGNIVANPEDGLVVSECPSGLKAVKRLGKIRFVGKEGQTTEPYLFENHDIKLRCDAPTSVRLNGKWGFLDTDGRLITAPPLFDSVRHFVNGHAAVQTAGKWGVIDARGRYTVEPKFETLWSYGDTNTFLGSVDGRQSWIDSHGVEVPEPDRAEDRADVLACGKDGGHFITAEKAGETLWGLADADGTIFVEPKYRALRCYSNGLAWVADDDRRMWCQIDTKGIVREPAACNPNFNGRIINDASPDQFADDPYESSVLWERALLDYGGGARRRPPGLTGRF